MPQLTDEQKRAAESIDCNVLVSAGAGSGKTMVLVERFVQVLSCHPDAGVNDIIAVTFTRKAAEEMRSRLKARLRDQAMNAATEEERKRWGKLLAEVDRARIGTIHSLCESILKAYPAEAGVDPQFEILDDLTRAKIINECVELSLQGLISAPDEDALALLDYPIESIRNWITSRLDQIPQYAQARAVLGDIGDRNRLDALALGIIERVRELSLHELFADGTLSSRHQYILDNPWPDRDNKLELVRAETAALVSRLLDAWKKGEMGQAAEIVYALSAVASPGSAGGPKGKPLRNVLAEIRNRVRVFANICPATLNEADERAFAVMRALVSAIDLAIGEYEKRKLELQRLDFNDLVAKTHALLCAPQSSTGRHFGQNLRALLVDEFQDTNSIQAELLSALCGETARLFLIGDDKQSIYKFQGADVSTFNQWKIFIDSGSHGLAGDSQLMDLSYSFRSHPSIVEFVNRFFRFYFHSDENAKQAPHKAKHRALVPSRSDEPAAGRVEIVVYDVTEEEGRRQAERSKVIESQAIAAWILEKIGKNATIYDKAIGAERPLSFGDFAILVQANDDFSSIESALADASIPYVTYAGSGFLQRQEILDLENMLRWLNCPEDDHSLIAILRSPFIGLNDAVIHRVCTEGQSSLWQSLQRAAKSPDFAVVLPGADLLKRLLARVDQLVLSELLRTVILEANYDIVSLSLPNGKQKSRNLWKFVTFAREYNNLSITDFLAALQSMRDLGVTKQTDAPLNADNSVKLMTIHKSKGLEFPAVILPVMSKKVHLFTPKLLIHRDFGMAFDTSRSSDEEKPAFFKASLAINNELEAEEKKRLLYVAMTRARDYLCMFIERSCRNDTSFRLWIKRALGLDCDTDDDQTSPAKASLTEGQHYSTRFLDDAAIEAWELEGRGLCGTYLQAEDVEQLSNEIGFDLLAPLREDPSSTINGSQSSEVAPKRIHWHRAERVTLGKDDAALHPTVVGNLFHAVMQHVINSNTSADMQLVIRLAGSPGINAVEPLLQKELVSRVMHFLNLFESSSLKELLSKASRVMSEVNYTVVTHTSDLDKRPDLIVQDHEGRWRIIDFKTDHMCEDDVPAKVNHHSAQLTQYVRDFEAITGCAATGWLYFADIGRLEPTQAVSYSVGKKGQLQLPIAGR